ncbi:hypothetical protein J4727_16245 [Providencia rettgeri]|uniref:Uncharacterized protein n=1 Tax=Providencia rettgeri TaxID=587 RepID=A0A939NB96_PRORE|nr:hypothetical protein [Providencia rettgeri]
MQAASNTTHTAVSEGEIVLFGDKVNQKQDVTDLSRYTDNAHEKLNMIFDKEKEQKTDTHLNGLKLKS